MSRQSPRRFTAPRGAIKAVEDTKLEAITAAAVQGLTVREAAKSLGLSYDLVWKTARRAGVRFRKDPTVGKVFTSRKALLATGSRDPMNATNYAGIKAALRW